jgi:hypothetical protein
MENSDLKRRILSEMQNLIAQSCSERMIDQKFEPLHVDIIKKHFNAADAKFDYHRKRVKMEIVMNDEAYDSKTINISVPTLHANFWFRNLSDFLNSCIDSDPKSLGFYVRLLKSYQKHDNKLMSA